MTDIESEREVTNPVAYPRLSDAQLACLRSYGTPQKAEAGEVLYSPGDATYDLIVTEDATVEIVQPATRDAPEESLVRFGPGAARWIRPRSRFARTRQGDDSRTSGSTPSPLPDNRCSRQRR